MIKFTDEHWGKESTPCPYLQGLVYKDIFNTYLYFNFFFKNILMIFLLAYILYSNKILLKYYLKI